MSAALTIAAVASVAAGAASAAMKPKPPKAAPFTSIDQQDEQRKAISGNLAVTPELQSQARGINTFNQAEMERMLELSLPGYNRIKSRVGTNTESLVRGEIPDDVSNAVRSKAASRSVYGGYGGSGMSRNLEARDLGLTSLDLMTKGMDSATRWMAATKTPTFDITSMFVRPPSVDPQAERNAQVRYTNDAARYEFVNDPWNQFQSKAADTFGSALQSYLGGMNFGGNTGGAGGGSNPLWSSPDPLDWSA